MGKRSRIAFPTQVIGFRTKTEETQNSGQTHTNSIQTICTRDKGKPKPKIIKILLDTGGSDSIIHENLVKKLTKIKGKKQKCSTAAGVLTTTEQVNVNLTLPELHEKQMITWKMHVTKSNLNYDMIIERDLLSKLGMDIMCSKCHVEWDHKTVPFKPRDADLNTDFYQSDSVAVTNATNRI